SSRRRHTRLQGDWSSDVCSSDLASHGGEPGAAAPRGRPRDDPRSPRGDLSASIARCRLSSCGVVHERRSMAIDFTLNQRPVRYDGDPAMPLLWYLRDHARLTGTKFGCGIGYCGACTVHLDGAATRSCVVLMSAV